MRNWSTVTGTTSLPSACTTVIGRPSIRTSKMLIDEPLMKRSRTRSPGRKSAVQLAPGGWPLGEAFALRILNEGAKRALPVIVVVALEFQIADDRVGTLVGPVRQHDNVIAIEALRVADFGFDDDRPINTRLFLKPRIAVIPVGAALMHRKAVDEGFAGRDAAEAEARHAVHGRGRAHAMPVDRARLSQTIGDGKRHGIAFAPAQYRSRDLAVDAGRGHRPAGDVHRHRPDLELKLC